MNNADGFDFVVGVSPQARFNSVGVCTTAPIAFNELGLNTQLAGHFVPQGSKVTGLIHQDAVAFFDRVD